VKGLLFLFRLRPTDKEIAVRREIDLISRAATCIPIADAMVCGESHVFNGRFAKECPCGDANAFSVEPTALRRRLVEVRKVHA
jgi:hypothetical protein